MKTMPEQLTAYKRTPEFTAETVPVGLLRRHNTKAGVWGKIVVTKGRLLYRILEPAVKEIELDVTRQGVVEPTVYHEVEVRPGVRFYVEFYR